MRLPEGLWCKRPFLAQCGTIQANEFKGLRIYGYALKHNLHQNLSWHAVGPKGRPNSGICFLAFVTAATPARTVTWGHDTEVRFTHARKIPLFISGLREAAFGSVMVEKPDSLIGGREDGQSTLFCSRLACVKETVRKVRGSGGSSKRASCPALSHSVVSLEGAVRYGGSNLQHHMRSPRRPAHLLLRAHPAM